MASAVLNSSFAGVASQVAAAPSQRNSRFLGQNVAVVPSRAFAVKAAPRATVALSENAASAGSVAMATALISMVAESGSAQAAQEVAQLAASDNRAGLLAFALAPALGWVAFNIAGPLKRQLDAQFSKQPASKPKTKGTKKGTKVGALAVGAAAAGMLMASNADAAQEVAQLAAGDGRASFLLLALLPALGWVAFNIAGPLQRQLDAQFSKQPAAKPKAKGTKKGTKVGALAVGAAAAGLLMASNADAAQEVAQLAAGDGRASFLLLALAPALGWVAYNIAGPLQRQLDAQFSKQPAAKPKAKGTKKGTKVGALAVGAAAAGMLMASNADAAQEVAQLAASDNRAGLLAFALIPALGWVAFNIAGPLQRQLDAQFSKQPAPKKAKGTKKGTTVKGSA